MQKGSLFRFPVLGFVLLLIWVSGCKAPREIKRTAVKPMSTNKLLKNIEDNAFDFEYLTIKRINCQYSSSENKSSFRINLKAQKNEQILIAISKLNIPVGRVLLTPDSVKYVNYIDHNYFMDDYSFISDFLNMDINFATIQNIISNNVFSYRDDPRDDYKTFDSFVDSGMYVLQSEKNRKIFKMENKKPQKLDRRLKRLDVEALILQRMFFDPMHYSLRKLEIFDKTNNRNVRMTFDEFTDVDGKEYPGAIDMSFQSEVEEITVKLKMSGFSTEEITSFSIKIPEKYEEIRVN
ncbi:DUF4292 domain-containing protein [Maribellus sp. YY47]|uniref:DUF4292 domain-containing protein n=1 Tax=Maribellus sp. YY47 TaxID=2929486 RepID=UPI002001D5DD|nr:DUF4292 domain-containing protein [Maribellus sp. YY47]MCK3686115.1 DUF4292 domain-containing protein [Maribellus sp. YY47]